MVNSFDGTLYFDHVCGAVNIEEQNINIHKDTCVKVIVRLRLLMLLSTLLHSIGKWENFCFQLRLLSFFPLYTYNTLS